MKIFILKIIPCLCIFPFLFSCASTSKSIGAGGAIGAGLGGAVGAIADPGPDGQNRVRNVLIGSAVGGALGIGGGLLADKIASDQREKSYQDGRSSSEKEISSSYSSGSASQPRLLPPRTEARWVSDQIRGSTFVPGHFEYVILEGAKWESVK